MNDNSVSTVHWSFWAITIFMLIWNVMGCINFFIQMNPEMVASYRENEQAIIAGRPLWATIAFAIAVFGGALGCILLVLKKYAAFYLFVFSLLGVVVTTVRALGIGVNFGVGEILGIILMPLLVAAFLIWYTKYVANKGWVTT
jgi:hypothetical protein